MDAPDSFSFFQVPSAQSGEAFAFHKTVASANPHIWPRVEAEFRRFTEQGSLFAVRRSNSHQMVGLCYIVPDEGEKEWELGGLVVAKDCQRFGIGTLLVRFAMAYALAFDVPRDDNPAIRLIAYVHEDNLEPRKLLTNLGFEYAEPIEVPAKDAPASMKRNSAGNLVGHKFRFTSKGLDQLSTWLDDFRGSIGSTGAVATLDLGAVTPDSLREAISDLASQAEEK